jgi:hypothetical protein
MFGIPLPRSIGEALPRGKQIAAIVGQKGEGLAGVLPGRRFTRPA